MQNASLVLQIVFQVVVCTMFFIVRLRYLNERFCTYAIIASAIMVLRRLTALLLFFDANVFLLGQSTDAIYLPLTISIFWILFARGFLEYATKLHRSNIILNQFDS